MLASAKVEILNKKLRFSTDEKHGEVQEISKQALELSKKIFGDDTIMTSKCMIDYGLTLIKTNSTKAEGKSILSQAQ